MRQIAILLTGLAIAGTAACTSGSDSLTSPVGGVNSTAAKGGNPAVTGTATASGAIAGSVTTGTFEGGNFRGSGTFTFDLHTQFDLVTGGTFGNPNLCGAGSVPTTTTTNFTTLSGTGGSLLEMNLNQQIVKSVRFDGWTPVSPVPKGEGPTSCSLHFRGDAVLDGTTEMSRMLTTCTVHDGTSCKTWTLQACSTSTPGCGPADAPAEGVAVGQLYGDFPRGVGNQPMARYEMLWSMTITKN